MRSTATGHELGEPRAPSIDLNNVKGRPARRRCIQRMARHNQGCVYQGFHRGRRVTEEDSRAQDRLQKFDTPVL
jgi:hypothetical protein